MNDLGHSSYKTLRGPITLEDMEWAADCIARQMKIRIDRDPDFNVTTEAFRDMHDDYADWWSSGLNTRKQNRILRMNFCYYLNTAESKKLKIIHLHDETALWNIDRTWSWYKA